MEHLGAQEIKDWVLDSRYGHFAAPILKNDLFAGGLILMVLGFLFNGLNSLWNLFYKKVKGKFFVSVEIQSSDNSFKVAMSWLAKNMTDDTKVLTVRTDFEAEGDNPRPHLTYVPASGTHFLRYKGSWIMVEHMVEDKASGSVFALRDKESLVLSTYGGNVQILKDMLEEALDLEYEQGSNKTAIFMCHKYSVWEKVLSKPKRSLESVILNDGVAEMIVADITDFLASKQWYDQRGLNYRRGYLFHGPPGCGKSSFLFAIAGHLQLNICALSLSDPIMNDQTLAALLRQTPKRAAILLEDIDSAFVERRSGSGTSAHVTFSGLLNALDGIATANDGQLIFMTTNHKERLAPALIRPGRVDMQVIFGLAKAPQIHRMFQRFYPGQSSEKFVAAIPNDAVSMAKLQGHFLNYKDSADDCLANVAELFKEEINPDERKADGADEDSTERNPNINPLRASIELSRAGIDVCTRQSSTDIRPSQADLQASDGLRRRHLSGGNPD